MIARAEDDFLVKQGHAQGRHGADRRAARAVDLCGDGSGGDWEKLRRLGRQHHRRRRRLRRARGLHRRGCKDDKLGQAFANDIRKAGVAFDTKPAKDGPSTACCYVMVTPDGERTMNT